MLLEHVLVSVANHWLYRCNVDAYVLCNHMQVFGKAISISSFFNEERRKLTTSTNPKSKTRFKPSIHRARELLSEPCHLIPSHEVVGHDESNCSAWDDLSTTEQTSTKHLAKSILQDCNSLNNFFDAYIDAFAF